MKEQVGREVGKRRETSGTIATTGGQLKRGTQGEQSHQRREPPLGVRHSGGAAEAEETRVSIGGAERSEEKQRERIDKKEEHDTERTKYGIASGVQHLSPQTYIAALQKLFDGSLQRQHNEQLLQLTSCFAARMD